MKLSAFKEIIKNIQDLDFQLPDGSLVPSHYHLTEVGCITKNFIDCGGTVREEKLVNFQLWYSDDVDHRLKPQRMLDIIELSEHKLGLSDLEIEVEYQSETIGKYGLEFENNVFSLTNKMTDCLAQDKCEVPTSKPKFDLSELSVNSGACTPGSGCC